MRQGHRGGDTAADAQADTSANGCAHAHRATQHGGWHDADSGTHCTSHGGGGQHHHPRNRQPDRKPRCTDL